MGKNVQEVKNSLKFKADEKEGLLTVRFGVKKFVIPHKARMMSDGKFMFLSFGASSELYEVVGKDLKAMDKAADGSAAYEALKPSVKKAKKGGKRTRAKVELPTELAEALKNIPAGYRLGVSPDGTPKLVKTRTRRKKGA